MIKKYSHLVCIGDEDTNEIDYYSELNCLSIFEENNYTFRSYPSILSEKIDCELITYSEPHLSISETLSKLILNFNSILELENPLIIYQFGHFYKHSTKESIQSYVNEFDIQTNQLLIDKFIYYCELLNSFKKIDIYGMFIHIPNIELPKSKYILNFSKINQNLETINNIFPNITVNLRSTNGNSKLADLIYNELFTPKKLL